MDGIDRRRKIGRKKLDGFSVGFNPKSINERVGDQREKTSGKPERRRQAEDYREEETRGRPET